jgi:predicted transcriptional regulator of viral defense system
MTQNLRSDDAWTPLWPLGVQGVLSHATALDLHGLCDINPTRIDVTVPRGFRTTRTPPQVLRLHREPLDERDVTWHEGLPIVNVSTRSAAPSTSTSAGT